MTIMDDSHQQDQIAVSSIPELIRPLLWSYRHEDGDVLPTAMVAAVIMDRGDIAAMRWLLQTLGQTHLARILPLVSRRLSPRSLALWCCILDLTVTPPPRIPWVAV